MLFVGARVSSETLRSNKMRHAKVSRKNSDSYIFSMHIFQYLEVRNTT
jgi:hypothetical protein